MSDENSLNRDKIASAGKVKLVSADSEANAEKASEKIAASDGKLASQTGPSRDTPNPERIMRDLPAEEFLKLLEQSTPEQLQTIIRSFEKDPSTKGGAKWMHRVFNVPKGPRSIFAMLVWWECRRPFYNLAVGFAGLPSVLFLTVFGMGRTAIFAALFYAFFANVCYCLGTPAEAVARACWKDKAETYGPVLLTLGTVFSVILTVSIELLLFAYLIFGSLSPRF